MCQIILQKPGGKNLPNTYISNSLDNNNDAIGISVATGEEVLVKKIAPAGTGAAAEIYQQYLEWRERYPESPILIHTRIGTSGSKDETNCHPFLLAGGKAALAHNGVFYETTDRASTMSDTNILVTRGISPLVEAVGSDVLLDPGFKYLCETFVTKIGSKLAFITHDNKWELYNENASMARWEDEYGAWFSNDSHCRVNSFVYFGNKKQAKAGRKMDEWDNDEYYDTFPVANHRPATQHALPLPQTKTLSNTGCNEFYKSGDMVELTCMKTNRTMQTKLIDVYTNAATVKINGEVRPLWFDKTTRSLYNGAIEL